MTGDTIRAVARRPIPWGWGLLLLGLAQTAILGWSVVDRIAILRSETEIVLRPEPVDPRDLFRGEYVILTYAISAPRRGVGPAGRDGDAVWASIAPDEGGVWRVVSLAETRPDAAPEGGLVLRGRRSGDRRIRYGIERYYVPEGEGRRLETLIGEQAIEVRIAVAADGRAAIKALLVEGETAFEEPWY